MHLQKNYPGISYNIVLAYLPDGSVNYSERDIYPEGIENVPKRFSIAWRNQWMLKKAEFVVTYVVHPWGGAAKFKDMAHKQNKKIINLPDYV